MIRPFALALILILVAGGARATPYAAVQSEDRLLGANDETFFVLRHIHIQPGSYYLRTERWEFIAISLEDGRIQDRCLLRETDFEEHLVDDKSKWQSTERSGPECDVFSKLAQAKAHYPELIGLNPPLQPVHLEGRVILITRSDSEPPAPLMNWSDIDGFARNMTLIEGVTLNWLPEGEPFCAYCEAMPAEDGAPECSLSPAVQHVVPNGPVFLNLNCLTGDFESSGARFFIPVSSRLFQGEGHDD
jgi:hypothetical protein